MPSEAIVTAVFSKVTEYNPCCTLTFLPPNSTDNVTSGKGASNCEKT